MMGLPRQKKPSDNQKSGETRNEKGEEFVFCVAPRRLLDSGPPVVLLGLTKPTVE